MLYEVITIPQGFSRLEGMLNPGLRLLCRDEFHEIPAFEIEKPLLVHQAAGFHISAT